ncbi:MAG: glycoside hydrolase family 43 protein [Candidatus Hodarchaeota archaeon]
MNNQGKRGKRKNIIAFSLFAILLLVNTTFALKIPTPPSFPCNSDEPYPGAAVPLEPGQYRNPVTMPIGQDIADPAVIRYNGLYYMTGTALGHYDGNIRLYSSTDLVNWVDLGIIYDAPNNDGDWNMCMFWASELFIHGGYFYLSYSASPDSVLSHHRIGIARATDIMGPYVDMKQEPMFDFGQENIDQHIFEHDGVVYMYYTNHHYPDNGIYVVPLAPDLNSTIGSHERLLKPQTGEMLIEAPWLISRDGTCYLIFSANGANTADYMVGYATASSPLGPFTRQGYLLTKNWWVPGPGHCSVVPSPDGEEQFMVYHAKKDWDVSWAREACIDRLFFNPDGTLQVFGPTRDPQPLPSGVSGSTGVVSVVNPGFEMSGLTGWNLDLPWDAALYSAIIENPVASRQGELSPCVFQGTRMLWFWSLISYTSSIQQDVGGLVGNTTYRLVLWGASSGRDLHVEVRTGNQALNQSIINGIGTERVSLDILLPASLDTITIKLSSDAGGANSWAWIDAVQLYNVSV